MGSAAGGGAAVDNCQAVPSVEGKGAHLGQAPFPSQGSGAFEVQNGTDGTDGLASDSDGRHPGERAEGFEPSRHVVEGVRVQGRRTTIVAGVECREHLADLGTAALSQHQPVGPHAQGFAHQSLESKSARPFEIGLPGLEAEEVGMADAEFRDVFDGDDAFGGRSAAEQCAQQGGFATAAGSRDEDVLAASDQRGDGVAGDDVKKASGVEAVERRNLDAGQADGQQRSRRGDWRQDGVNSDAVPQACVDARARFVDMSPTEGDESHGERPQFAFTREKAGYSRESTPPVCPDAVGSVHKHVRDVGIGDERGEDTELAGRQTGECSACGFGWGGSECRRSRWNGGGQGRRGQRDPRRSVGAGSCIPDRPGYLG